jgi:TolA-binding protein
LGVTQENLGKSDEAFQSYEKAAASGEPAVQGEALLGVARTAKVKGNVERARSALEQIKKQFADTPWAAQADAQLLELPEVKAAATQTK